ncbi:hypothetical protein PM082_013559 [Marasmius tenuissimus]|nr:hypothetical protein PM082_013559 [Marasmius tenuissimus]
MVEHIDCFQVHLGYSSRILRPMSISSLPELLSATISKPLAHQIHMNLLTPLDCIVVGALSIWLLWLARQRRACDTNLPPGPRSYPIIGSALAMPRRYPARGFAELGEQYGDIIYLKIFNQGILVLNSQEAAFTALCIHGESSSGRPSLVMAGTLSGYDRFLGLMQNDKRLQDGRKYLHGAIGPHFARAYADAQQAEVMRFLKKLESNPDEFMNHCKWIVGACILLISHGYTTQDSDDPFVLASSAVMKQFGDAAMPAKWLVDVFPFLIHVPDWFPGAGFKRIAARYRLAAEEAFRKPYMWVKNQMREGSAKPSLVASFLESMEDSAQLTKEQEEFIMFTMGDLFGAGIETMTSTVTSFFLAMAKNPSTLRKAQFEIDSVCTVEHRLPMFKDKSRLPYVEALAKELMRWGAMTPLGLPHRFTRDETVNGYHIPKDTIAFANIGAISFDQRIYPEPHTFSPERFLGSDAQEDPRNSVFGFGRRICPGAGLAEQIIFIIVSCTLATFDIRALEGESYDVDRTDTVISMNKPFMCDITLRSKESSTLIV